MPVEAAGRTDAAIARDLLRHAGVEDAEIDARAQLVAEEAALAYEELCPPDLSARVAPGIPAALEALAAAPGTYRFSLVTGNFEPIARRKLAARGHRGALPGRPGRLRLRRRGPGEAARRSRASAPAAGRASAPS